MPSLTAHLVTSGDHGRLGFHPDCPVCRQGRLFGSLNSNAVVSPRAKAALASGVLAFSAVGPGAAIAQEPDLQLEGGTEAGQADAPGLPERSAPLPPNEPSSPPVPEPTPAPDLASPAAPGADDVGSDLDDAPIDREPVENQSPPVSPPADPGAPEAPAAPDDPTDYQPEAPPEPGAETPEPGSTPFGEDAETEPQDGPALAAPAPSTPQAEQSAETFPRKHFFPRSTPVATPSPPSVQEPSTPVVIAPTPALSATTQVRTTTEAAAPEPPPSPSPAAPRCVIVEPGDSLWSIATRLLGKDASPARIARKVSQLWTLNEDRIGTGRPDLVRVGTKLKLR